MKLKKYPTSEEKLSNLKSNAQYQVIRTGMEDMFDENVNEGKGFVVFYKVKKDKDNRNVKPSQAAYSKEVEAKKFLQSVEKDGGNGMIVPSNVHGLKEANEEPQVIQDLRWIVKHQQNKKIKDPVSGRTMTVDLFSASAVTQVYDIINDANKKKYVTASLPKMVSMAFKLIKK